MSIEDNIVVSTTEALYDYMNDKRDAFQNHICKKILYGIKNNLDAVEVLTVEILDIETIIKFEVDKEDYINDLIKNFNGLVVYEDYELAAEAKKYIDNGEF